MLFSLAVKQNKLFSAFYLHVSNIFLPKTNASNQNRMARIKIVNHLKRNIMNLQSQVSSRPKALYLYSRGLIKIIEFRYIHLFTEFNLLLQLQESCMIYHSIPFTYRQLYSSIRQKIYLVKITTFISLTSMKLGSILFINFLI